MFGKGGSGRGESVWVRLCVCIYAYIYACLRLMKCVYAYLSMIMEGKGREFVSIGERMCVCYI